MIRKACHGIIFIHNQFLNPHSSSLPRGERTLLPLPEGEGWGEGEKIYHKQ